MDQEQLTRFSWCPYFKILAFNHVLFVQQSKISLHSIPCNFASFHMSCFFCRIKIECYVNSMWSKVIAKELHLAMLNKWTTHMNNWTSVTLSEIKYGERKQSSLLQTSSRLHQRNNQVNDTTYIRSSHDHKYPQIKNSYLSEIRQNLPAKIHQVMSLIQNHLYHGHQDAWRFWWWKPDSS